MLREEESSESTGPSLGVSWLGGMSMMGSRCVSSGEHGCISTPPEDASSLDQRILVTHCNLNWPVGILHRPNWQYCIESLLSGNFQKKNNCLTYCPLSFLKYEAESSSSQVTKATFSCGMNIDVVTPSSDQLQWNRIWKKKINNSLVVLVHQDGISEVVLAEVWLQLY